MTIVIWSFLVELSFVVVVVVVVLEAGNLLSVLTEEQDGYTQRMRETTV